MLLPFLAPICLGAVFAAVCFPYRLALQKKLKIGASFSSILITLFVSVIVILPLTFIVISAVQTGIQEIRLTVQQGAPSGVVLPGLSERIFSSSNTKKILSTISQYYPINLDQLRDTVKGLLSTAALSIGNWLTVILSGIPGALLSAVLVVMGLFFFLQDGERALKLLRRISVFDNQDTQEILKYSQHMCRSVLLAMLASGAAQAVTFSIACMIAGVAGTVLITASVFFTSFLPLVGSAPVTLGVATFQFLLGNNEAGIILLIAAGVVSALDNFIRPMVIKGAGDLHPMLTFLSALGGMKLFGVTGVFLGPIVAGISIVILQVHLGTPPRRR